MAAPQVNENEIELNGEPNVDDDGDGICLFSTIYSKSLSSLARAVLGFTPQALAQLINSAMSTLRLAVSQL